MIINIILLDIKRLWKRALYQTNFNWCHLISHHKMLFYYWKLSVRTKDWHSYGHRRSFMLGKLLSKYVQQLTFIGSPRASNFLRMSRFIENLCTVNDDGDFSSSYKYIYPQQIELKLEHQGYWTCNSLWFGQWRLRILYLHISVSTKGASFLSSLNVFLICRPIFHHQYSMVQYFRSSYE